MKHTKTVKVTFPILHPHASPWLFCAVVPGYEFSVLLYQGLRFQILNACLQPSPSETLFSWKKNCKSKQTSFQYVGRKLHNLKEWNAARKYPEVTKHPVISMKSKERGIFSVLF